MSQEITGPRNFCALGIHDCVSGSATGAEVPEFDLLIPPVNSQKPIKCHVRLPPFHDVLKSFNISVHVTSRDFLFPFPILDADAILVRRDDHNILRKRGVTEGVVAMISSVCKIA